MRYDFSQILPTGDNLISGFRENGAFVIVSSSCSTFCKYFFRFIGVTSILFEFGCVENPPPAAPNVATLSVFNVYSNEATVSGQVISDGGASILMRGVCWSDTLEPDLYIGDTMTTKPGKGVFLVYLNSLTPGRKYKVRAFAINSVDTALGNVINFTAGRGTEDCGLLSVYDIDSNRYTTREMAGYCWMQWNLRTSRFRNGDSILHATLTSTWPRSSVPAFAVYQNNPGFRSEFGYLYNWAAVNDPRGICPTGWRVAKEEDWQKVVERTEGWDVAGGIMKRTGFTAWQAPNTAATDGGAFRFLGGGKRDYWGDFNEMKFAGYWWSTTEKNYWNAMAFSLRYNSGSAFLVEMPKESGLSVRCIIEQ